MEAIKAVGYGVRFWRGFSAVVAVAYLAVVLGCGGQSGDSVPPKKEVAPTADSATEALAEAPGFAMEFVDGIYRGHAIAMHGDIKYGTEYTHFNFVNPAAPKGGKIRLGRNGSFDSLNNLILKGTPASSISLIYNNLMARSVDEPLTMYGELVEFVEMPEDRSWVRFALRPEARWHDGKPVTVEDVIFSLETIKAKGHPFYRSYWADVESAEKVGDRTVQFTFGGETNLELPLIIGQMTILPKHYWEGGDFSETTLEPPLGSGPYRIGAVDAGRSITYERVAEYWGRDMPFNRGQYNFDTVHFDYYRDGTVAVEALKGGAFDYRAENSSKDWATAYDVPARQEGKLVQELIAHQNGTGMQGFVFNTRRAKFADPQVRQALGYAFDFEWTNTYLFYGQYTRTKSYFSNTELASSGTPEGRELEILEQFRGRIPDQVFGPAYQPPTTDGSGNARQNLRAARQLLVAAGWEVADGKLTHRTSGEVMAIEFLLLAPSFERIVAPYVKNLEKLGVEGKIRIVDTAQYQNRLQEFDFDATVTTWGQSQSPGNEQRDMWTTKAAETPGSRNYAGIKDKAINEMVEILIAAPDRQSLVASCRALDRVLSWGYYAVPHWHITSHRMVYWDRFGKPAISPKYAGAGGLFTYWWEDADKVAQLGSMGH